MKEEKMKKKFGDRKDGKRVKKLDSMHALLPDLKPNRCDSDVYINQKIDVTNLVKYIKEKNENSENHYTYFHAFATAIAKTIYNRPLLNRFVQNHNYYDRNEVKLAFVAKVEFTDEAEEMLTLLNVKEEDNIDTVRTTILEKISKIRERKGKKEDINGAMDIVASLPKFLRIFVVWVVKWLDKHGWLPTSLVNDNIYYSSVIMSNLGSIKCGAIYHNLTDFGTNSILLTIGEIKKEKILNEQSEEEVRDICEFGINLDERIADGFYFAKSVRLFAHILNNPELLEGKASEKIEIK